MAIIAAVEDPGDPALVDFVGLRDAQLRRRVEHGKGIFIAEGEKIIRRAAGAGCRPRSVLLQERWLAGLADLLVQWPDVPVHVGSAHLLEQVSGFHVHRGALAAFERPAARSWDTILGGAGSWCVRTSSTTPTWAPSSGWRAHWGGMPS